MNQMYQGTLTGTMVNGVMEVAFTRVAPHSCTCDECRELDKFDLPLLTLSKRYLSDDITIEEFQIEREKIDWQNGLGGPRIPSCFKRGSADLETAIGFIEIESGGWHIDHPFREQSFKDLLRGLIYGYEIRMRDVHFWTIKENKSA